MKRIVLVIAALCVMATAVFFAFTRSSGERILTFNGLHPVRIGMTLEEAEAALGTKLISIYPDMPAYCWFGGRADGVDAFVSYGIEKDKIVRIDVDNTNRPDPYKRVVPPISTERGIHSDTSSDEVRRACGDQLIVDRHSQGDENDAYMSVLSDDKQFGLFFVIWDGKVDTFQAGTADIFGITEPCDH